MRNGGAPGGAAQPQVLLVHRPRHDDWSLPKGKLEPGEHPLAAAVREVHEESGVWGVPGVRLPTVTYQIPSGSSVVDKIVDWWVMTVANDGQPSRTSAAPSNLAAPDEVDDSVWLPITEALERLTYDRDRRVVSAYAELPPLSRPVVLLHHATVDARQPGSVPSRARPLDPEGQRQADTLTHLLGLLRPARLISADSLSCRQTLSGLAQAFALDVDVDTRFDDDADPDAAAAALRGFAGDAVTVVCSENPLVAAAMARLSGRSESEDPAPVGGAVVLSFSGDRLVAADPLTTDGAGHHEGDRRRR